MLTPSTVTADTLKLWNFLPPFVQEQDAANGYQFLSWLDGSIANLQTIDNLCRDQQGAPGWSQILDVSRCPVYALPWLAQFVGTRFTPNVSEQQMREQIVNPAGWLRGTVVSIQNAASVFLNPGYSVTVLERTPDPYSITIQIPGAGLIGGDYAYFDSTYTPYSVLDAAFATYAQWTTSSAALIAALLAAIPAGINATLNFI